MGKKYLTLLKGDLVERKKYVYASVLRKEGIFYREANIVNTVSNPDGKIMARINGAHCPVTAEKVYVELHQNAGNAENL